MMACKQDIFDTATQQCKAKCDVHKNYKCCALCDDKLDCEYFCGECGK